MKDIPEFLTLEETAKLLRISMATMYRIISGRHLPFYKIGKSVRIDPKDVSEYLKQNRTASRDEWK